MEKNDFLPNAADIFIKKTSDLMELELNKRLLG